MVRPAVPAALAGACAIAVVGLWLGANELAAGRELDARAGAQLERLLLPIDRELLKGASSLADTLPFAVGAAALAALAWLRGGRRLAVPIALVLLLANVVAQVTQIALRGAQQPAFPAGSAAEGSWPSGHAAAAMLLALGAIVVAGPRLRAVTALAGLAYALGVGVALVGLGGHLPGDVLAGFATAAAFTAAGAALLARGPQPSTAGSSRSPLLAPALGALAGAAVFATGLGKALVTRRDEVAAVAHAPLVLGAATALTLLVALGAGAALALRR